MKTVLHYRSPGWTTLGSTATLSRTPSGRVPLTTRSPGPLSAAVAREARTAGTAGAAARQSEARPPGEMVLD